MKKILSVLLAVMMLFSCVALSASAVDVTEEFKPGKITADQVAVIFNFNGGSSRDNLYVFNGTTGAFDSTANVIGTYYCLPQTANDLRVGTTISLPVVTAPSGNQFTGWRCQLDNRLYAATDYYQIPVEQAGKEIQFIAEFTTAAAEGDTLQMIMGVLIKVFGSILGFIMFNGDTEAGIAFMQNAIGNILA